MLILATLAALTAPQAADTTIAVRPGTRLDVSNQAGAVVIRAWERSAVRVTATRGSRDDVELRATGDLITLRSRSRRGGPAPVDYEITVPHATPVSVSGPSADITIDGVRAPITAETVEGHVRVRGGSGYVSLRSVEGEITVDDARGRVSVGTVEGDVRLTGIAGEITAETVEGDITLDRIESALVEAKTVEGDVSYRGSVADGGRYRFTTHDGDLDITAPPGLNATVAVATFEGDFESDFPVTITGGRPGRRFSFTLGTGSARLELESFEGSIRLRRAPAPVRRD